MRNGWYVHGWRSCFIGGTVIGVFIISLLQQGIMAFGLGKGQQMIITGIIVIVAVYADVSARRRKTDRKGGCNNG